MHSRGIKIVLTILRMICTGVCAFIIILLLKCLCCFTSNGVIGGILKSLGDESSIGSSDLLILWLV